MQNRVNQEQCGNSAMLAQAMQIDMELALIYIKVHTAYVQLGTVSIKELNILRI